MLKALVTFLLTGVRTPQNGLVILISPNPLVDMLPISFVPVYWRVKPTGSHGNSISTGSTYKIGVSCSSSSLIISLKILAIRSAGQKLR